MLYLYLVKTAQYVVSTLLTIVVLSMAEMRTFTFHCQQLICHQSGNVGFLVHSLSCYVYSWRPALWSTNNRSSLYSTVHLLNPNRFLQFLYHFHRKLISSATMVKL